jgi:transcriptional regulator with XRE-family HTH domain
MLMNDTARNLKLLRVLADLSQLELARRSGLHYTTISAYETGGAEPKQQTVEKVLEALELTEADLKAVDFFRRQFAPESRAEISAPPTAQATLPSFSDRRREAAKLTVEATRLSFRLLLFVLDLLFSIAAAVLAKDAATPVASGKPEEEIR